MNVPNLVTVARGRYADNFEHHSLEVHLGPQGTRTNRIIRYLPRRVVVAGEDVSRLCSDLPRMYYNPFNVSDEWNLVEAEVDLEIKVLSNAIAKDEKDGCGNDPPSVKRLLEPFRQLYGYHVAIEGDVTTSYKESIKSCAAEPPPTVQDVICMVSKGRDEGNEAKQRGSLGTALSRYQSALDVLTSAYKRLESMLLEYKKAVRRDLIAMDILQLSLRSLLADTYLKVGEYAKSYVCAQDLACWYDGYDDLYAETNVSVVPDLAHMMFCKVLAGKALGEPIQALRDISEALIHSPTDEAMEEERRAMEEERRILCILVRKKLQDDVRMTWAGGLNMRTKKSKKKANKSKKAKRSKKPHPAAEGYDLDERQILERWMEKTKDRESFFF